MKLLTPPRRGMLHKALSEGCGMWTPVVLPVKNDPLPAGSGNGEESSAMADGMNPQGLFSAHQSQNKRSDKQDDENKEQDLGNLDGPGGDAGKTE